MQHLEGSGTPVLYIKDARFLKVNYVTYVGLRQHHDSYTHWCVSFHCVVPNCTAASVNTFTLVSKLPPISHFLSSVTRKVRVVPQSV